MSRVKTKSEQALVLKSAVDAMWAAGNTLMQAREQLLRKYLVVERLHRTLIARKDPVVHKDPAFREVLHELGEELAKMRPTMRGWAARQRKRKASAAKRKSAKPRTT